MYAFRVTEAELQRIGQVLRGERLAGGDFLAERRPSVWEVPDADDEMPEETASGQDSAHGGQLEANRAMR